MKIEKINKMSKLTIKLKFRTSLRPGISTNSNKKPCGNPPSKPSIHSTCIESDDWFDTEQFCNGNGRPIAYDWEIKYIFNKQIIN